MQNTKNLAVHCEPLTRGPIHHFFGYYDKSPWDTAQQKMLATQVGFNGRLPTTKDEATLGVIDLQGDHRFHPVATTKAWNWQQGAMLQWLPGNSQKIIYNDRRGESFVSVLVDLDTQNEREFALPIYTIGSDGLTALSIDFDWLSFARPGYGYSVEKLRSNIDMLQNGIFRSNLNTGEIRLILSYQQILEFEPHPTFKNATHWVEHLLMNATSSRFMFLHRYQTIDGAMYTRLLTATVNGEQLYYLTGGMVSHYCWRNPNQILVWAREFSLHRQIGIRATIRKVPFSRILLRWMQSQQGWVRQQIIGDAFRLYTDLTTIVETVGRGIITEDGHPSYSPDGQWLLSDTYPDVESYRHLFLFHTATQQRINLGSFYSPPEMDGGWRCDLHPRWSPDGRHVCIDSGHDGTRQMYVLDVGTVIDQLL